MVNAATTEALRRLETHEDRLRQAEIALQVMRAHFARGSAQYEDYGRTIAGLGRAREDLAEQRRALMGPPQTPCQWMLPTGVPCEAQPNEHQEHGGVIVHPYLREQAG